jgi:hypothetical protein
MIRLPKSELQKERGGLFTQIYNSVKNNADAVMQDWTINCWVAIPEIDMQEDTLMRVMTAGKFGITEYSPNYANEYGELYSLRARRAILYDGCLYTRYGVENCTDDYLLLKAAYDSQSLELLNEASQSQEHCVPDYDPADQL